MSTPVGGFGAVRQNDRRKEAPQFVYVDKDNNLVEYNDLSMVRKLSHEDARAQGILALEPEPESLPPAESEAPVVTLEPEVEKPKAKAKT